MLLYPVEALKSQFLKDTNLKIIKMSFSLDGRKSTIKIWNASSISLMFNLLNLKVLISNSSLLRRLLGELQGELGFHRFHLQGIQILLLWHKVFPEFYFQVVQLRNQHQQALQLLHQRFHLERLRYHEVFQSKNLVPKTK